MKFTKEEVLELRELADEVLNSGRITELKISQSETPHLFARISNAQNESKAVEEVLQAVLGLTGLSEEEIAEKTRPVSVDEILGATSELAKTGLSKLTGFLGEITETVKEKTAEAKQHAEIRKELKSIDEEVAKILNQANDKVEEVEEEVTEEENYEARQEALSNVFSSILDSLTGTLAGLNVDNEDKLTLEEFAKELEKDSVPEPLDPNLDDFEEQLEKTVEYMKENDLTTFNGVSFVTEDELLDLLAEEIEEKEDSDKDLEDVLAKAKSKLKETVEKVSESAKDLKADLDVKAEDLKQKIQEAKEEKEIEELWNSLNDECPCEEVCPCTQPRFYESDVEEAILLSEEEAEYLFSLIEEFKYTSDILFEILETRNPFSKYLGNNPETDHRVLADLITLIEKPDLIMVEA